MKKIQKIISEETDWDFEVLKSYCRKNSVNCKRSGELVILDYMDDIPLNLWNDFNRQCRGVILDMKEKAVLAHPFDKFFNLGGHPETMFESLPIEEGYEVSTKFDGSMMTAYSYEGRVCFATRYALQSDLTKAAHQLYIEKYKGLGQVDLSRYTLVFELIMESSEHIVTYDKADIVLIGIRDRSESRLLSYEEVLTFAQEYELTAVNTHHLSLDDVIQESQEGSSVDVEEGWVLRFGNGLLVKIKTWQYIAVKAIYTLGLTNKQLMHRICTLSPDAWETFVEKLPKDARETVMSFRSAVELRIEEMGQDIMAEYEKFADIESRKEFAMKINQEAPKELISELFYLRAGRPLNALLMKKKRDSLLEYFDQEVVTPQLVKDWKILKKNG